ncbi:uncharacterized protein TNCT_227141 [Trichonephila clavata]|uniref:Uncharacterized protein n=1 Tax=Trichonephila clavata TaxID=2740835 RepID=A0A8X6LM81_TRICU|nr:uncharacterized protein TNCT_227141 [Trichonephila clavata]
MTLGWEIYKWYECHEKLLQVVDHDLRNKLHWFSFGIIDRLRTARNFIQDVNWNIQERFHLACKYYFEDDVKTSWRNMSTADRSYIMVQLPRTIDIWLQTLSRNIPLNWREIPERRNFFRLNILGMRSYFANLRGSESRFAFINYSTKSISCYIEDIDN